MTFRLIASPIVLVLLTCCAGMPPVPEMAPGTRPAPDTDEAGLWYLVDEAEYYEAIASSAVIRDPELQAYLESVMCRTVPEYCRDIRIYVLPNGEFSAYVMPNGAIGVSTGLLLQLSNEAQLAAVLGHEVVHYAERHGLIRYDALRSLARTRRILSSVIVAGIGVAAATQHGHLAGTILRRGIRVRANLEMVDILNILRHSREQEAEADLISRLRMASTGYDVGAVAELWTFLESEEEARRINLYPGLLLTHPRSTARARSAEEDADTFRHEYPDADRLGDEEYMLRIKPFRHEWLLYARSTLSPELEALLIERQWEIGVGPGLVLFHEAGMLRKRNGEGDQVLAVATFRDALGHEDHPPETHRELGLALWKIGETGEARQAFHRYLTDHPDARPITRWFNATWSSYL